MQGYTQIFAWGADFSGQLGLGSTKTSNQNPSPRFFSFNTIVKKISCGQEHSVFISDLGHVYSMGSNSQGRLGLDDRSMRSSNSPCLVQALLPNRAQDISCGRAHTLVSLDSGALFAWGSGDHGALGSGNTQNSWRPIQIMLPHNSRVLQVSAGANHSAVVAQDSYNRRVVLAAGANQNGQLGTGKRERELFFVHSKVQEEAMQVAAGFSHTLILTVNRAVLEVGWGNLVVRKVRIEQQVSKISCWNQSGALTLSGELYLWTDGEPKKVVIDYPLIDLAIGSQFGLVLDSKHQVLAWGVNRNGELGMGDYQMRERPSLIRALQGKKVNTVECGAGFAICLGNDIINRGSLSVYESFRRRMSPRAEDGFYVQQRGRQTSPLREKAQSSFREKPSSPYRENLNSSMREISISREDNSYYSYRTEIENLAGRLESAEQKQAFTVAENEELRAKLESEKRAHQRTQKLLSQIQNESRELQADKKKSQYELENLGRENSRVHQQVRIVNQKLDGSSNDNEILKRENRNLNEKLQKVQRNLEQTKQQNLLESQANSNQHKMEVSTIKDKAQHQIQSLQSQNQLLTSQLNNLRNQFQLVSEEKLGLQQALSQTNSEVHFASVKMEKASNQHQDLLRNHSILQKKFYTAQNQIAELTGKLEQLSMENKRIKDTLTFQIQEQRREVENLSQQNSRLNKQNADFKEQNGKLEQFSMQNKRIKDTQSYQIQELKREIQSLNQQIQRQNKLNTDYLNENRKLEQLSIQNNRIRDSLSFQIQELKREIQNLNQQIQRLNKLNADYLDQNRKLEQLSIQNNRIKDSLSFQIQELKREIQSIAQKNSKLNQMNAEYIQYNGKLDQLSIENKRIIDSLSFEVQELKRQIENLNQQNIKLNQQNTEYIDYNDQLLSDNHKLNQDLGELEANNRQLFDNLQKELAQRAKQYKERTISVLNTPNRTSVSPLKQNSFTTTPTYQRENRPSSYSSIGRSSLGRTPGKRVSIENSPPRASDTASGLLSVLFDHSPKYISSPNRFK